MTGALAIVKRLRTRGRTKNGSRSVGAGDGDTYTLGYYDQGCAADDCQAADLIEALHAALKAVDDNRYDGRRCRWCELFKSYEDMGDLHEYGCPANHIISALALTETTHD